MGGFTLNVKAFSKMPSRLMLKIAGIKNPLIIIKQKNCIKFTEPEKTSKKAGGSGGRRTGGWDLAGRDGIRR